MRELIGFWVSVLALVLVVACHPTVKPAGPCDVDGNGKVDQVADYEAFRSAFGSSAGEKGYSERADFDKNGFVNGTDFNSYLAKCSGEKE